MRTAQVHDPAGGLREACIEAARRVIAERGVEGLSLRDVARTLGVSHQAPYKHFPSRDHLLAEVIGRCFREFAARLDALPQKGDPASAMEGMGAAYLSYAREHPLEYRLMFGTPWPDVDAHPELLRDARRAFDILRDSLSRLRGADRPPSAPADRDEVDRDALFVWSTMHGLATILQSNVMDHLALRRNVTASAPEHVMKRIDTALAAGSGDTQRAFRRTPRR